MQVAPDIKAEEIKFAVREAYGIQAKTLLFLALGADLNTAVFRMVSDDQSRFFLKLRKNDFRSESSRNSCYFEQARNEAGYSCNFNPLWKIMGRFIPLRYDSLPFY